MCDFCKCDQFKWDFLCLGLFMWARCNFYSKLNSGIILFLCGSCALMLCNNLGMCDSTHVPYPCSIVCNTFGIFTSSYPNVMLDVNHCYTTHPSIFGCQIYNFPCKIYHLAPPIFAQPRGWSNPLPLVVPLAQDIPSRNNISIGPICLQSRHMRDGNQFLVLRSCMIINT